MAGLEFKVYLKEIEVIKSLPQIASMHDEIIMFIENDKPEILSLYNLREAVISKYKVIDEYDDLLLEEKHFIPYDRKKNNIIQDVFDLINLEIDRYGNIKKTPELIQALNSERKTLLKYIDSFKTFSSDVPHSDILNIGNELIKNEFIEVNKVEDFLFAFTEMPLKDAPAINWQKIYTNKKPDMICLGILIHHLSPEETLQDYKIIYNKILKLFQNLPPSTNWRSFEAILIKVKEGSYKMSSQNVKTLLGILKSY